MAVRDFIDGDGVLKLPETINVMQGLVFTLTEIGANSFDGLDNLKELCIPPTVKKMQWSFFNCRHLRNIHVDEANTAFKSVDGVVFSKDGKHLIVYPNAHGVKEYHVPSGTKEIDHFAFKTNQDIEEIYLPEGVTGIGNNAFYRCEALRIVHLPDSIRKIGDSAGDAQIRFQFEYKGELLDYENAKTKINK